MHPPTYRVRLLSLGILILALALGLAACETNADGIVKQPTTTIVNGSYDPCGPVHEGIQFMLEQVMHWTPDGAHLLFDYQGTIQAVDLEGTQLRTLVDADPRYPIGEGGTWISLAEGLYFDISPDGTRITYTSCEFREEGPNVDSELGYYGYEIAVINLDGTGKQRLTRNDSFDHYPAWSPDGKRIAYFSSPNGLSWWGSGEIYTMEVDGSAVRQGVALTTPALRKESEFYVAIVADGSDLEQGTAAKITPTLKEKTYHVAVGYEPPLWSPDGEYLALLASHQESFLYIIRADGKEWTRIAGPVSTYLPHLQRKFMSFWTWVWPVWSPDGELLAFVMADEEGEPAGVYTVRPDGTDLKQVLASQGENWIVSHLSWSSDGLELLIGSDSHFYIARRDGSNAQRIELADTLAKAWRVGAWSPDDARIALYVPGYWDANIPPEIYTVNRDGSGLRLLVRADDDGNLVPANPLE